MPYLPARWRDYVRESGVREPGVRPLPAAVTALRDPRLPSRGRAARLRPRAPAHPAARPVAPRRRGHALHLRHRRHPQPRLGRRDGPRGERLAARRVARGRTAAARLGGRRGAGPGPGGGGDRPGRRPPRVRAGAPARADARAAGHPGATGRSTRPPSGTGSRSPSTRAGRAATRSPRSGPRATTWRSTSASPRRSRRRSSAWSAKASRCGSRALTDRARRIRVHLAAAADVAAGQELEGPAPRGALGGPAAVGDDPRRRCGSPPSRSTRPTTTPPACWRCSTGSAATAC